MNISSCKGNRPSSEKIFQWEIVRGCNYTCSYCSVSAPEKDLSFCSVWKDVLKRMEDINKESFRKNILRLWGGEPTLHPEFKLICDSIKVPFTVYSNLSNVKILEILDNEYLEYIICSLHLSQIKDINVFIDRVSTISKKKPVHLNIMLEREFIDFDNKILNDLNNVKIVYKPIDFIDNYYNDEMFNEFRKLTQRGQSFILNGEILSRFDILNKKIRIKKFVKCDINKYFNSIDIEGNFYTCLDKTKLLSKVNENTIICHNSYCMPYMLEYGNKNSF